MGATFALEHANIVSYLTSKNPGPPPSFLREDLSNFLIAFAYNDSKTLFSSQEHSEWPGKIKESAKQALERLDYSGQPFVEPAQSESVLINLKEEFSSFDTYFLFLSSDYQTSRLRLPKTLALRKQTGKSLTLIPELQSQFQDRNEPTEMFNPFPAISVGLHAFDQWPGYLCWNHSGKAAFVPASKIDEFVEKLDAGDGSGNSSHVNKVLERWGSRDSTAKKRLLHLSDLHFGTDYAIRNKRMLVAEITKLVNKVDRIVITGDLFDTPKEEFALQFAEFCDQLTAISSGKAPIYVPGNHDIKVKGIWGKNYEQIANIRPTTVEADNDAKMVFIGFNSSEEGHLAQGSISTNQLTRIGTEYHELLARNPNANDYLPVVLLHHHPFSYENEPVGALEKAFRFFGVSLEPTLKMVNPESFYGWCADWNVSTVLHGHKHSAKHIRRNVGSDTEPFNLTAIGCGSSLGAEGSPVSCNLLEWDPASNNWAVSFYQSKNGGAFKEKAVALSF